MVVQMQVKFRAGKQVIPEGPEPQKRHQKLFLKAETIWDKSSLGTAIGFVFWESISPTSYQDMLLGRFENSLRGELELSISFVFLAIQ